MKLGDEQTLRAIADPRAQGQKPGFAAFGGYIKNGFWLVHDASINRIGIRKQGLPHDRASPRAEERAPANSSGL